MSITDNVTGGANILTGIIQWVTNLLYKIINGTGTTEIVIICLIIIAIWFLFNIQNISPRKVYKH